MKLVPHRMPERNGKQDLSEERTKNEKVPKSSINRKRWEQLIEIIGPTGRHSKNKQDGKPPRRMDRPLTLTRIDIVRRELANQEHPVYTQTKRRQEYLRYGNTGLA